MLNTTKRILELVKNTNIAAYRFEKESGIAIGSIQAWKSGKANPSEKSLQKIANYLGVTVDYLCGIEKDDIYKEVNNITPTDGIVSFEEIGTVKAGFDGTVDEIRTGNYVDIPISALNHKRPEEYFVLTVKGSSMYPKLIEGDKILCLRCDSVDSGDLAVVLYNGDEATVKKVNYVYGQDWLELIPINPEYETKRIKGAELQLCRVLGKVVKLIRDF